MGEGERGGKKGEGKGNWEGGRGEGEGRGERASLGDFASDQGEKDSNEYYTFQTNWDFRVNMQWVQVWILKSGKICSCPNLIGKIEEDESQTSQKTIFQSFRILPFVFAFFALNRSFGYLISRLFFLP